MNSGRRFTPEWRNRIIVALIAGAVRALYFWQASKATFFVLPLVDADVFDHTARALADGSEVPSGDWYFQGVGYPLLLGLTYRVFAASVLVAKAVQLSLGVVTSVLTYELGRRLFDRRIGLTGGIVVALYLPLVFFEADLVDTAWTTLAVVALPLLTLWVASSRGRVPAAVWGLVAALAGLVRATFLPFAFLVPALALTRARRDPGARPPWVVALLTLCGVLVCFALRALGETGRFTVLPSAAGLNLFLGNNPDTCHWLQVRPGFEWHELLARPQKAGALDIWQQSDWFRAQATHFALSSPGAFLRGLVTKALTLFTSREIPRNIDVYLVRDASLVLRVGVWRVAGFGFPFGVLFPASVLGLVRAFRRFGAAFWLLLGSYAFVLVAVFVVARYRVVLTPLLAIAAGAGAYQFAADLRLRKWPAIAADISILLGSLLLCTVPGPFCQERGSLRAELDFLIGAAQEKRGDRANAELRYRTALLNDASYNEPREYLGHLLLKSGRFREAADELRVASARRPLHVPLLLDLASSLGQSGQLDEAINVLARVVDLAPQNAAAHNDLGIAWAMKGDARRAVAEFQEAVQRDPGSRVYQRNLRNASRGQ